MTIRNRTKADTAANWTAANTILKSGEFGIETDTGKLKVGNGSTAWNSLTYNVVTATVPATGSVTNAQLANVGTATFKGRTTAGTGAPEDLTAAQMKTALAINSDMAALTIKGNSTGATAAPADLSVTSVTAMLSPFTDSTKGLVPAGGGGLATTTLTGAGWVAAPAATLGLQQKTGIIAYFYPDTAGYWAQFAPYGTAVRMAIMNPASGPGYGSTYDSGGSTHTAYSNQIATTQAAGIPVVHYLSQNYFDLKAESSSTSYKGTVGVLEQFTAATTDVITTTTTHGFTTGMGPFQVKAWPLASNTLPAGLAPSVNYWWRTISTTTGTFHTSQAGANANTGIVDVTSTGTGTGFYLGLSKTLANIQNVYNEIDLVLTRYPTISGFFLDEMNNDGGTSITAVQSIYDYIKAKAGNLLVVQNPGAGMPETYINYADTFMSYEGTYATYTTWTPDAYMAAYPAEKFWHAITDAANATEAQNVVNLSRDRNAATVTCNSGSFSNLPSYFADTMAAIAAGNATLSITATKSYGTLFFDQNPSSETACVANTWIKAKGWTTPNGTLEGFVHSVDGRLTYSGDTTKTFLINAGVSFTKVAGTASTVKFGLRKNGVEVTYMERWTTVGATSTDYFNIDLAAVYSLTSTDYVEIWCQTSTGDNLVIQRGQIIATEI